MKKKKKKNRAEKKKNIAISERGESGRETARYRGGVGAKYSIESAREKKLKR